MQRGQEAVGDAFISYFQHLFESEGVERIDECLPTVNAWVQPETISWLIDNFSHEEINTGLAQMQPLKSPGPDGFGAGFYQHHCDSIGEKVRKAVMEFLHGGALNPNVNETFYRADS